MIQPFWLKSLILYHLAISMLAIIFGKEPFALLTSTSLHSNKKNTPIDDELNNWGAVQ